MPPLSATKHGEKTGHGLKTLDVSNNQLTCLPQDLACLAPHLNRLILKNNQITTLIVPRGLPASIVSVDLDNNELIDFSASQEPCESVCPRQAFGSPEMPLRMSLYLPVKQPVCMHCQHKTLPFLTLLTLGSNNLDELSFNLSYPEPARSRVEKQPMSIRMALRQMTSEESEDEELPTVICPNLNRLHLERNQFCSIPNSICELEKLKGLNVSHNKGILHLPWQMGKLRNLYDLGLDGLSLMDPPPHIIQQRTGDIIGFLSQRLKQ